MAGDPGGPRNFVPPLQLAIRAALAAAVAAEIALHLWLQFPLYAMISAVIVTDLSAAQTRALGLPRLAGTVVGSAVGAILSSLVSAGPAALAPGVFSAMGLTYVFRLRDAAKVAGYVCGIILLDYSAAPWSYAASRLSETALGIAVAVLVSYVPKLLSAERS